MLTPSTAQSQSPTQEVSVDGRLLPVCGPHPHQDQLSTGALLLPQDPTWNGTAFSCHACPASFHPGQGQRVSVMTLPLSERTDIDSGESPSTRSLFSRLHSSLALLARTPRTRRPSRVPFQACAVACDVRMSLLMVVTLIPGEGGACQASPCPAIVLPFLIDGYVWADTLKLSVSCFLSFFHLLHHPLTGLHDTVITRVFAKC